MAVPLGTAIALPAAAAHAAPVPTTKTPTCPTGTTGDAPFSGTITTNLFVPAGTTCYMSGSEVMGNVTVNGVLYAWGDTFDGNVSVSGQGSAFVQFNWGDTIKGNLSITGSDGNGFVNQFTNEYSSSVVDGNLYYTGNLTNLKVENYNGHALEVKGNLTYLNNQNLTYQGPPDFSGLVVDGGHPTCDVACP
jgi:hypothetical protein